MLVIISPVFAQESGHSQKKQRGAEICYGVGVDNNKYIDVNRFLRDNKLPGNFNTYNVSYTMGLAITREKTKFEMYLNFSIPGFKADSKKFKLTNHSLQFLYHYKIRNKGWLHTFLYSGISMFTSSLQIDSIYKPSGFGTFSSINADKLFFDIPIGLQITHYFPNKKGAKPNSSKYMIGLKAAYHATIYQDDWAIGQNTQNNFSYLFKEPDYFELNLILGFYR